VKPETFEHHKVFMTVRPIQAASLAHAACGDSETNMKTLTITLALMRKSKALQNRLASN
jgi:hypothetical protein